MASLATGFLLYFAYNDPRNAKHNATKTAIDNAGGPTTQQEDKINSEAANIKMVYVLSQAVGIVGAALTAASIVLFIVGPRPGVYDEYKTVEVGSKAHATIEISPTLGGAMLGAHVVW